MTFMHTTIHKLPHLPRPARSPNRGFTIVELLIVIVVIGILAAIVIVAFNGVQNRANDTAIRSDLSNIAKKLEIYRTFDASGQYPTSLVVTGLDIKVSKNSYGNHHNNGTGDYNLAYCRDNTIPAFALIARSKSGTTFAVSNDTTIHTASTPLQASGVSCIAEGVTNTGVYWGYSNSAWPASF